RTIMQNADIIRAGIVYIEQNLKTDITPEELARRAGYSVWHYQRLFAQVMGVPLAAYINRRRLDRALAEIGSKRKAINAAMEYGFDSYAGFYKAFLRMYGCSPKKYLSLYGTHQPISEVLTMFTEAELRKVLNHWDIPQDLAINDVKIVDGTKTANNVWQVGRDYFLKTGDRAILLRNARVAKAMEAQGFTAAVPVPTKKGGDLTDDQNNFVLIRRLKGEPLPKAERFGADCGNFGFKYGQSIARLHNALAAIEADIQPSEHNLFAHVTEWALPNVQKQNTQWNMGIPDSFFEEYIHDFGTLFEKLPKQLIHRDPNPCNILFCGGDVSGFIDFDLSERNIRLWDPCYCATGILSEQRNVEDAYDKFLLILDTILHGYDSINPLTAEEKEAIYYVICSIQMICVAYFESVDEYKDLARTNREMLVYIIRAKEQINKIFK
ncbi:MAG: helix-turn-helix domain-containing protein, partial [Ruminiclostridium sp.]|nr:helix-turn-helix domain-containing protein [Ruminiclostridium sp.]